MLYADNFCTYTETYNPHTYHFTDGTRTVSVLGTQLYKYRKGALLQVAFPDLSPSDREFLLNGDKL